MEKACETGAESRGDSSRFHAAEDCSGLPGAQVREKRGRGWGGDREGRNERGQKREREIERERGEVEHCSH